MPKVVQYQCLSPSDHFDHLGSSGLFGGVTTRSLFCSAEEDYAATQDGTAKLYNITAGMFAELDNYEFKTPASAGAQMNRKPCSNL